MTTIISSNLIGAGTLLSSTTTPALTNLDGLFVLEGVTVASTSLRAVNLTGIPYYDISVAGTLFGELSGIYAGGYDENVDLEINIDIASTGKVLSDADNAIEIQTPDTATGEVAITNAGEISTSNKGAILIVSAPTFYLQNSGRISSTDTSDNVSNAVRTFATTNVIINNSGLIESLTPGEGSDPRQHAAVSSDLIDDFAGSVMTVFNSGDIIGAALSFYSNLETVELTNTGLMSGDILNDGNGGTFAFSNFGMVNGDVIGGLLASDNITDTINNSGTINGDVTLNAGNDDVTNTGQIMGAVDLGDGDDSYRATGEGEVLGVVSGGDGNDILVGSAVDDAFQGGDDDDIIDGKGGDDLIDGGDGFDYIKGGDGNDDIVGEGGKDTIKGGSGDDLLDGGNADDMLKGNAGQDELIGGKGLDSLWGHDGDDTLEGGDQNDVLYGGGDDDILSGGAAKDSLYGGTGDDILNGDNSDDLLNGGNGDDELTGGNGADVFQFNRHAGNDIVTDFEDGIDDIDLSAFNFASTGAAKAIATDFDGGVLFDLALAGGSGTIFIENITKADINGSDLIL